MLECLLLDTPDSRGKQGLRSIYVQTKFLRAPLLPQTMPHRTPHQPHPTFVDWSTIQAEYSFAARSSLHPPHSAAESAAAPSGSHLSLHTPRHYNISSALELWTPLTRSSCFSSRSAISTAPSNSAAKRVAIWTSYRDGLFLGNMRMRG